MPRRSPSSVSSRAAALVLAALLLALSAQVGLAAGAPEEGKKSEKSEPINITSDRMESNAAGDVVTFTGNVVATQQDGMLKARLVRVFYKTVPAKAPGQEPRREIQRIEAEGDVMLVQGDKVGTGDRGIYSAADRTMVLIGNAKVRQDRDWITGTKVTYYLDEERSVVESGPGQRVNSLIHSDGDEGARQAP